MRPKPKWVYDLFIEGCAAEQCWRYNDGGHHDHPLKRLWWRIEGAVLTTLFGWWWYAQ